jgi:uncharacterized RDD family membrane protein YckC
MSDAYAGNRGLRIIDPQEIGWWVESADEELYGPVSRKTLRRFLEEGTISANTLVRHCTQLEVGPVADQPGMTEGVQLNANAPAVGDRLAEAWPRKWRDRQALAEGEAPCSRHNRPAILFCARCHAPYCYRCQARPYHRPFYFCRACQAGNHNRRFVALLVDSAVLVYAPMIGVGAVLGALGPAVGNLVPAVINVAQLGGVLLLFVRDGLFGGAGPGKRLMGLRVVRIEDGTSPPGIGRGALRWVSQAIPFFNLVDALVPLRDPLQRRYGDRWARTRVIDTEAKLATARARVRDRLARKGVMLATAPVPVTPAARPV